MGATSPNVNRKRFGVATIHGHRATLELFRLMVERVKDYAIFLLDPEGNIVSWNEGMQRIKGYSAREIIGQHMSVFYTPEDAEAKLPYRLLQIAKEKGEVESEGWRLRKDGSRFWADVVITVLRDQNGVLRGFGEVTRDLTERKAAQDALSELAGRLIRLRDEERKQAGQELHDTTSPLLTSLTGKLYSARQRAHSSYPELSALLDEALMLTEATGTMVRTMEWMLYPPLLLDSGLLPALRWYVSTFSNRTDIPVELRVPDGGERLRSESEGVLFRVAQEALRTAKNARASKVQIQMESKLGQVVLTVDAAGDWAAAIDDFRIGRGDMGTVFAGLRERLKQLGGSLELMPTYNSLIIRTRLPR
jgi:PAS domain S-box-containing protein